MRDNLFPFLAKNPAIYPPADGWKAHTLYLVAVCYRGSNPIHKAYLQVGFLDDAESMFDRAKEKDKWRYLDAYDGEPVTHVPGNYSTLMVNNYDNMIPYHRAFYLKVLQELHTTEK